MTRAVELALGDRDADRVVPPTGHTVWLTVLASAAMAFLAVFALAFALAVDQVAEGWSEELSRALTVRLPPGADDQLARTMEILSTTPGIASATQIDSTSQADLLEPWLGTGLDASSLPLPLLIDVQSDEGLDLRGLALRLHAEVPEAVLDDHATWRAPLIEAAAGLRAVGWLALALIAGTVAAIITLGAQSALAANAEAIRVLRLVGARDGFVIRAFTRRFTLRALAGAAAGTVLGGVGLYLLPAPGAVLPQGLALSGAGWLWLVLIPLLAGLVALLATKRATARALGRFE
nr:hypothetical protein [Jannaschia aquimarina]